MSLSEAKGKYCRITRPGEKQEGYLVYVEQKEQTGNNGKWISRRGWLGKSASTPRSQCFEFEMRDGWRVVVLGDNQRALDHKELAEVRAKLLSARKQLAEQREKYGTLERRYRELTEKLDLKEDA